MFICNRLYSTYVLIRSAPVQLGTWEYATSTCVLGCGNAACKMETNTYEISFKYISYQF
jgi:hypothetical protein